MITRPLELASRLRPEPRNFDALFFVNAGLIVLFFDLFGSRFVLSPGLKVQFEVAPMAGAQQGASLTTYRINVVSADLILIDDGTTNIRQLPAWLKKKATDAAAMKLRQPSLLVLSGPTVPVADLAQIASQAREAGFGSVVWGAQEPATGPAPTVGGSEHD